MKTSLYECGRDGCPGTVDTPHRADSCPLKPGESQHYHADPDKLREILRKSVKFNSKRGVSVYAPVGMRKLAKQLGLPPSPESYDWYWERAISEAIDQAVKLAPNVSQYYHRGPRRSGRYWIYVPDHAIEKRRAEDAKREADKARMDVIEAKLIEHGVAYERNWEDFTLSISSLELLLEKTS